MKGLRRGEVNPDGPALPAFLLEPECGGVPVLMEVRDLEPARRPKPDTGIEKGLENRAVPGVQERATRRHPHELARPSR